MKQNKKVALLMILSLLVSIFLGSFVTYADTDSNNVETYDAGNEISNDSPLVLPENSSYKAVPNDGSVTVPEGFSIDKNGYVLDGNGSIVDPDTLTINVASAGYTVKNSSGSVILTTYNLFEAINKAASANGNKVYITNTTTVVFARNDSAPMYYVYQYCNYYGSYSTLSSAISWCQQYNYSRTIGNNGSVAWDYRSFLKGSTSTVELNRGGYYEVKAVSGYNKVSGKIMLTSAKFKKSQTAQLIVPYCFYAFKNSAGTYEVGIFHNDSTSKWDLYYKTIGSSTINNLGSVANDVVSGSEISGSTDVNLTVAINTDGSMTVTANSTVKTLTNTGITSSCNIQRNISCVTSMTGRYTPDYRNMGYFKNVVWQSNTIYNGTTSYSWGATSTPTSYAMVYNTDVCSGSASGTTDTINIFYDSAQ